MQNCPLNKGAYIKIWSLKSANFALLKSMFVEEKHLPPKGY